MQGSGREPDWIMIDFGDLDSKAFYRDIMTQHGGAPMIVFVAPPHTT